MSAGFTLPGSRSLFMSRCGERIGAGRIDDFAVAAVIADVTPPAVADIVRPRAADVAPPAVAV